MVRRCDRTYAGDIEVVRIIGLNKQKNDQDICGSGSIYKRIHNILYIFTMLD